MTEEELQHLIGSFDVVGDIAIIIIPPELEAKEGIIGDAIINIQKNVKVAAKRNGIVSGEFRTIPLKIIAGENRKETIHKEHGVRFFLNPEKVYFSVRSNNERKRVANLARPGEEVLVMFSGIGAFPLVIAKLSQANEITGIEKNKIAHEYALQNLAANRKINNVKLLEGDVKDVLPTFDTMFDRVIMPLPKTGELFIDIALVKLKKGGWLHFYDFQQEGSFDDSVEKVRTACQRQNRELIESESIVCGHPSPRVYRICVDAKIR